jgi:uncharacterized protein YdcH (DUF465 family)
VVRGLVLVLILAGGAGCDRIASREQLAKQVLKEDPEFEWVLDTHRALTNRIKTYERELALKRSAVEQNIAQMRMDLAASTASVKHRIEEVKKQLDPDRQRMELALLAAVEELRVKRFQRASLGRSIAQLRKASRGDQTRWTDAERAGQQEQLREMVQDAQRLDHEIASLKAHMRLLKIKLLLIRF